MDEEETPPLGRAAIRILAVVFAALVVAVGFFEESIADALAAGVVPGAGSAVVGFLYGRPGTNVTTILKVPAVGYPV